MSRRGAKRCINTNLSLIIVRFERHITSHPFYLYINTVSIGNIRAGSFPVDSPLRCGQHLPVVLSLVSIIACFHALDGFFFRKNSRPPRPYDIRQFEVEKQRENGAKKAVHARFEPGTLKSLGKLSFFPPARPPDFTPRVRREWKQQKVSLSCPELPHVFDHLQNSLCARQCLASHHHQGTSFVMHVGEKQYL